MSKETIKGFLKPDWRKILVFSFISVFSFSSLNGCCSCCPPWVETCILMCCPCYNPITWPYFWVTRPTSVFSDTFGVFLSIVYWYFLSSLMISAYDAVMGKKRWRQNRPDSSKWSDVMSVTFNTFSENMQTLFMLRFSTNPKNPPNYDSIAFNYDSITL